MPAAHMPASMSTLMFALHMPTSYNLPMLDHITPMTFMMTHFMTALHMQGLSGAASVSTPMSTTMPASFVFPPSMPMRCVPVPMLYIHVRTFMLLSICTCWRDWNRIMISMAFSKAERTDQLPVGSTIDLQWDVVTETDIHSRLSVNDNYNVFLSNVCFVLPNCMPLAVWLDIRRAEFDSLTFSSSADVTFRVCRSRVVRWGVLQSCIFKLLYHFSKHGVLVKSRPRCERLSALRTAEGLRVLVFIPVILNASHAVVMSTRNCYWILKWVQTDRTAERVLVLESYLCHFTFIIIKCALNVLYMSVQVSVEEQNKEAFWLYFVWWDWLDSMWLGMQKTNKEVWYIEQVVLPVLQVFWNIGKVHKCKAQKKGNHIRVLLWNWVTWKLTLKWKYLSDTVMFQQCFKLRPKRWVL